MVFPRRSTPPNSILLSRKEVSLILLALHQHPRVLLRRQLYPTCDGHQLLFLVRSRCHLPVLRSPVSLQGMSDFFSSDIRMID